MPGDRLYAGLTVSIAQENDCEMGEKAVSCNGSGMNEMAS